MVKGFNTNENKASNSFELWLWVWNIDSATAGNSVVHDTLVVRDAGSRNTYWNEEMTVATPFTEGQMESICERTNSTFVHIGNL